MGESRGESEFETTARTERLAAVIGTGGQSGVQSSSGARYRALMVDLNNFSTFPTLAVGILVAALRNAGHDARVIVPLAHDVPAVEREQPEDWRHHWQRRLHLSTIPGAGPAFDLLRAAYHWRQEKPHPRVLQEFAKALDGKPDVILLSAYLQHYPTVVAIARLAARADVPLILGGPAFNLPETAEAWRSMTGLTAIVGAEVDLELPAIVEAAVERRDLLQFRGVLLPDGRRSPPAPPLRTLDLSPVPDFTDFPWNRYRTHVIPLMTGRGCQWARCRFCSDVVSASGRSYRTRSVESVVHEMREQGRRHATANFLFLDLKLNSHPAMMRGIAEHAQTAAPGAQWIGTVHVDGRPDNGLSKRDLQHYVASGMRRISFGLESGSQRLLDLMEKGCTVEANSAFIRHAHEAGLSVRCTMFRGYPGETAEDLERTADFLEAHTPFLGRVRFNNFSIPANTPIWHELLAAQGGHSAIRIIGKDSRHARARYRNPSISSFAYRRAKKRVLAAVFAINRRRLRPEAQMFDGLM